MSPNDGVNWAAMHPANMLRAQADRIAELQAENVRLREALRELLANEDVHQGTQAATCPSCRAYNAARSLLSEGERG